MKKLFLTVLFAAVIAAGTGSALDFTSGPEAVQPGNILVSGGFALGNASAKYDDRDASGNGYSTEINNGLLFGFSLAADYALPFFGLTAGVETGYSGGNIKIVGLGALPIMARLGYHPNLDINKLDAYALLKLGTAMILVDGKPSMGFGFGFGLGGRYFFMDNLAAFAEVGLDNSSYNKNYYSGAVRKFLTLGVTYKFKGFSPSPSDSVPIPAEPIEGEPAPAAPIPAASPESDFSATLSTVNRTAMITGYSGRGGKVVIPNTIQGMPVVQIAESAFRAETRITEIVIPEGVTTINTNAFLGCSRLTTVTLPSTIRIIGAGAFNNCGALTEVFIPVGTRIQWSGNTFTGCSSLLLENRVLLREFGYTGTF